MKIYESEQNVVESICEERTHTSGGTHGSSCSQQDKNSNCCSAVHSYRFRHEAQSQTVSPFIMGILCTRYYKIVFLSWPCDALVGRIIGTDFFRRPKVKVCTAPTTSVKDVIGQSINRRMREHSLLFQQVG